METLEESILPRTARFNIAGLDIDRMAPILNDLGDKFRAIIRANKRERSPDLNQPLKRIQQNFLYNK